MDLIFYNLQKLIQNEVSKSKSKFVSFASYKSDKNIRQFKIHEIKPISESILLKINPFFYFQLTDMKILRIHFLGWQKKTFYFQLTDTKKMTIFYKIWDPVFDPHGNICDY